MAFEANLEAAYINKMDWCLRKIDYLRRVDVGQNNDQIARDLLENEINELVNEYTKSFESLKKLANYIEGSNDKLLYSSITPYEVNIPDKKEEYEYKNEFNERFSINKSNNKEHDGQFNYLTVNKFANQNKSESQTLDLINNIQGNYQETSDIKVDNVSDNLSNDTRITSSLVRNYVNEYTRQSENSGNDTYQLSALKEEINPKLDSVKPLDFNNLTWKTPLCPMSIDMFNCAICPNSANAINDDYCRVCEFSITVPKKQKNPSKQVKRSKIM